MEPVNFDLSITISAIIAIAAVISPILTAVINNFHQKNMKKIELEREYNEKTISYQKSIFEDYLHKAGDFIGANCSTAEASKAYTNAYLVALLYAPIDLQKLMHEADDYIEIAETNNAMAAFEKLIPAIQEYLKTL